MGNERKLNMTKNEILKNYFSMATAAENYLNWLDKHNLNKEDISPETIAKEKEILLAQPDLNNKPAEIAEKIIQGRINKFYSENCFVEQLYVKDDSKTVKQVVAELNKDAVITCFAFYELTAPIECATA